MLVVRELTANPILFGFLLGAILVAQPVDWNAFYDMSQLGKGMKSSPVRRLMDEGTIALNKAHDELEKPARELGIIDRRTKRKPTDKADPSRIYEKPGDKEALEKEF